MKMLFFDYREQEKPFFDSHTFPDYDITFYEHNLTEKTELSETEFVDTEILSVFVQSQITEEVINKFKNLRMIATRSSGYNHIDLQACEHRNIAVLNVEGYGRESVAQYTIGAILALTRNLTPAIKDFQLNDIDYSKYTGYSLSELSIGVIGTGAIGSSVCKIANDFGMNIFAFDYKVNDEIKDFVDYVSLDDLYKHSNVITLHIPYIPDVYHMISKKEFDMMSEGVYIVNSSRGELIDNVALYEAIKNNKVAGAALDVLECENLNMYPDDFIYLIKESSCQCLESAIVNQKLIAHPNVIITPHIAYNTYKAINTILENTFLNIKSCLSGKCLNRVI